MRMALIGEAWGREEEDESQKAGFPVPFVGGAGRLLNAMCKTARINRPKLQWQRGELVNPQDAAGDKNLLITNVFNMRPPDANKVQSLLVPRKEAAPGWERSPWDAGKYLPASLLPEIERLTDELRRFKPDVIVALGKTPLWALLRHDTIMERRGTLHSVQLQGRGRVKTQTTPLIPTIHPAFVLRQYHWFTLCALDLAKARRVGEGLLEVEHLDYIDEPTLDDLKRISKVRSPITFDIETRPKFRAISCIGVGTPNTAVCCPFVMDERAGRSYWPTTAQEVSALKLIRVVLENPDTIKIGHNVLYDIWVMWDTFGIEVMGEVRDTIIMHRNLVPELPHALGQIAPNYRLYPPWKSDWRAAKDEG